MKKSDIINTIMESDPIKDWTRLQNSSKSVIYSDLNVNLRIESSLEDSDIQCQDFKESWATKFPDKKAVGYYYNVWYANTLMFRVILVTVDGGRASLPLPDSFKGMQAKPFDKKIAEIENGINDDYYSYLTRAGIK